jgi:hypothetical protein
MTKFWSASCKTGAVSPPLRKKLTCLVVFSLLALAPAAKASLIYSLTSNNCSGGCSPSPFGTVTLTQNGTSVDVSVDLNAGNTFVNTGGPHPGFAFNLFGNPSITITGLNTTDFVTVVTGSGGSVDASVYGFFQYEIDEVHSGNSGNVAGPLTFNVSAAGTVLESNFIANSLGWFFVADIFAGATGNTGEVASDCLSDCGGGGGQLTPEPVSFLLVGTGLIGAFFLRPRRAQCAQ